jgi:hypothetical protein
MQLIEQVEGKGDIYLGNKFVGSCAYIVKIYQPSPPQHLNEGSATAEARTTRLLLSQVRAVLDRSNDTVYTLRTADRREMRFTMDSAGEAEAIGTLAPIDTCSRERNQGIGAAMSVDFLYRT